jgi:predicted AAA+ superfamily ATPase
VNLHKLGASLGVSHMTVRRWIDILMGTFVVRALQPWSENVGKRLVRSPKLYIADTGLLHSLLDVETSDDLHAHPSVGASWESFAISQVTRCLGARPEQCFFYATHAGGELDLLVVRGRERLGFEIKRTAAPSATKSMRIAVDDLRLKRLDVIHAGSRTFPLDEHIRAVALHRLWRDLDAGGHR